MAINPPEGIADFLAFVSGMEWPEADEDLMRRVSEHYGSIARDLETLSGYVIELIPIVKNDFDGEAADSFLVAMRDLTGQTAGANQLEQTAELSRQLSEVALKVANQVEYSKIMAILQLVQLLAEILFATLFSAFTFGAVWGPVSALFAATREGLHQLFRWLLQTILSQTFIGIMGGIFQDTVIQLYQLNAGHITTWNTESLIDSIKQGALSGLVAGPLEILSHYGGNLLGRLLGGKTPGSIISKRVDDVLNKIDDKLDDITPNPKPDVPTGAAGGAGAKSKLDDLASKTDKDLPPIPPNKAPDVTPPPVPPKTVGDGIVPPPATGKPKAETPGGAPAKDKPNTPATGTPGAPATGKGDIPTKGKGDVPTTGKGDVPATGKGDVPTTGKGDVPATGKPDVPATGKGDVPTTGKGDVPATGKTDTPSTDKPDVPAANKTETVGGNEAPGAGKAAAGDAPTAGTSGKTPDASTAGRAAGDAGTPLDDLLATKEARSAFAKDVGELLGGVSRNLETGFMRLGEGTIAESFSKKMGDVFSEHLGKEGAREAGEAFGEMLTRKWVRLGADHTELPELLTKAMGDFGQLAPLKNLADSMPNLFNRSEHSNALARVFKQENPLQGSPMYQLGGAVASLLNEGTNEMLSEGFYNLIFGDGTFTVSGGPFAAGVAMGALSHGLHRAFEPIMVRYQNWVLSHQHAENPHDSKYFGLLHPINIASFVANMTGNPAPWPVPRPTSEAQQDPSFTRDMKDMVKWVFSNPITGTPFFADLPQRPDVTVESDGDGAFAPLDLDLGPSFGDEIAKDPLFRTESDGDTSTDDGGRKESEEGSDTPGAPSQATVSSDLPSLLGSDTDGPAPNLTDQDRATARPVTQSDGDRFTTPVQQENGSPARTEAQAEATTVPRPHPLQAEMDRAAAEGLDYLIPYDGADDDTAVPDNTTAPVHTTDSTMSTDSTTTVGDDGGSHHTDGDQGGDDGTTPPPDAPVRDIPAGIAVGVLSPAQTTALQSIPQRPGVFVVGMHTDPNTPHDPDAVLKALTEAHDDGRLDGITEIQFTACGLASPVHENTVKTVMSGLWKHRATTGPTTPDPLTARAADAPVWYVPTTGGDTTGGHLLTAQHIGLTPDGKIAVVDEGTWHVYGDSGGPDHTPVRTTPEADALPDDAVRFLFRTPAIDAEHPDAVKFGPDNGLPDPLTRHLPRERWAALLSDPTTTADLLAEVTDTPRSPDGPWHTMDAEAYQELRKRLGVKEGDGPSADAVEEAFSSYSPDPADDAATRLEAVVTLVRDLHADADEGPLTPDVQILLQRLLQDQGFPPARLPDAARTTTFWTKNKPGFLTAELTLGMADATNTGNTLLTGELTVSPAPTPSDDALSGLLQDPDGNQKALLRELLDGAHHPESPWHTLDAGTYLALRSRVEGGSPEDPSPEVRQSLDRVLREYGEAVRAATTRVDQLRAVADTVLKLHATAGLAGTPEAALTAHSRFLVPRMLLDLGITPAPLPDKLHAETSWQPPKRPPMRAARIMTFATSVAGSVMDAHPSWSRPLTSTPEVGTTPGIPPSDGRTTDTGLPSASDAPAAPTPQDGSAPDGNEAPEPKDWREELDALGTRTKEETAAYLVLPEPPLGLVGRADRLLRTDDRPYTTLTKDLPTGAEHWLTVRVPAGHGIDTGDGRILVGKDRTATVTLTGPDEAIGSVRALEKGLRPPNSPEDALPLSVLSRVGQALHVNPGDDEHHTAVRTAVRTAYAEASRDAERALGEYLTRREDVQKQVQALVTAAWDRLSDEERRKLGSAENGGSGSVGNDLGTLRDVVENGNIREQMHLLVTGVHGPLGKQLMPRKPEPRILTRERSAQGTPEHQTIQQATDVVRDIRREQERLRKDEAANPDLEALVRAAERHRRTELRPEDTVPPLSERERAHVLEDGRLTWEPGERHRQIALRTESQVTAEATGGLMSAGTSNTTYFTLTVVHAMAQKWKIPVDFQLVRLALMADMLPIGHHTFHEVMTASEAFEKDVLARQKQPAGAPPYTDVLSYTDDWGRFRSLAPLTENTLREAMPGGRFPDETALGLEAHERTTNTPSPPSPDATGSPSRMRRTLRALPGDDLKALLDRTPGLTDRTAGLLREALGDGSNTSRDWRRFDADSFLDLRQRFTRPDDAVQDPQTGVWDELDSLMERWYADPSQPPDVPVAPEPDPLDSAFDAYYTALAGDPGDRSRLTALADLLVDIRKTESLQASDPDVSAALGVVTQRLLVDQGYPPALWGTDIGSPDFWPGDTPGLVQKLETAIGDFTRAQRVRQTPSGIAVGPMNPAQSRALNSLPPSPGVFTVGTHTDPGAPHDPDVLLKALTDAHDQGRLTGITEIRFTGCDLATPLHDATVKTVMSGLWKHRATTGTTTPDPLTARAADAPVWYVPTTSGNPADGRLLTAQHIGLTPDGKIAVVGQGTWHVYGDSGNPDHTPVRTTPDADTLPENTVRFPSRTPENDAEHPDAVKFGRFGQSPPDNGEGSSSSARSQPHQAPEQSPPDNAEGSNTGAVPHPHQTPEQTPVQTAPGDSPLATARDARIEDLVRIRYMQESEAFERRLADHLFDLAPVQEMAAFLARAVVGTFRGTPFYEHLSQPSRSVPGAVGTRSSEWERVAASGNARERMTLFFQAIASTALPTLVGFPADYPRSLHQERLQRENNPDSEEYKTLDAFRQQLGPTRWNSPEHARANERWRALDSVLRPFRAVEVHPPLSATEERRAVNSRGRMIWNPGGASLRIRMDQMYQQAAEQAGRLVRSGTSGSGFYFHRYAEMLAGRLNIRIDHRDLRLAVIAAFVSEGHHTLPEVLAASSLFAEEYLAAVPRQEGQPPRPDVQALLQPVGDPTPAWDRYSVLPPLSPDHLRREVARDGLFPHEHAENLRRELEERRGPDPQATEDTDSDSGSDVSYETDTASDESYETDSDGTEDDSDDSDDEGTSHGGDVLGKGTSRRDDSSPHVPEDSPHSLPGQLRPEEVSPADLPVTADRWSAWQWTPGRQDVPPPARIRTERFDPAADPDVTGPFPGTADRRNEDGTLAGHRTRISADVQRFVVPPGGDGAPGGTVRLVRVTLPVAVDGSWSAADVTALGERLQGLLDSRVNLGFRLPRGGDQLHMEVVLDPRPVPLDGTPGEDWITVSRDAGPGNRSDQLHFRLHSDDTDPGVRGRDDAMLLHEVLHYAGLPDRYHDAETLFRHTPDRADASGVMATATLPDGTLPRRYLEAVEDVTESGPVLHDNLGPGTWSAPESVPVRDIPAGIAVGVLSPAQTSALRAFPPSPGVFVVGMHTDPNTPHDPDAVLKALTEAHDDGRLDGITEIQFTACGLASPVHENTVKTVMSGLWKHRSDSGISTTPDPLTARAADAPVWYIPTTSGNPADGHLLTAQHIGLTPDGKIAVVGQGTWHVYGDTGGSDHTPVRTTPDADALPDDAVRFLFRTPAIDAEHPDAVKFGPDNGLPEPLTRHVPRERWAALLSDPATTGELLTEVTATRRSPGDPWHTMDATTYGELRKKLGVETDGPSADTVEEAFSSYSPDPADDAATRLEAVVSLVRDLHADADDGPLTPDAQILLQRLLQDQGFPPARLPDAARTTTFWTKNEPGFLAAELTLGIADATEGGSASLTGEISVAPVATPVSDQSLSELLQDPDGGQKTLLRELLDGAHRPESSWHTLDATTYLALRTRVEGGPPDEPGKEVRDTLDQVLNTYRASLEKATTRVDQLKAVAEAVLSLHATAGVPGSPENALTAHSRFLVPRMLLDLGITPVPLPDKLHAKAAWQTPKMPRMRNTRVLNFATSVADSIMNAHPSWSRPLTSAPADVSTPDVTSSGDPTAGGDTPDASAAPGAPAHQDGAAPAGDGAPEPRDWREELNALGTRTKEESTAYLVLPESPVGLVGRADRLLRTDDRPYTTLTKDLPSDTGHWLAVRVPAGHGTDTGDGRILVGKDRMATATLTGPADAINSIQALEQGLRPPGSSEQPLPLAVLSRVGQALHVNPDHDEHHTTVRTAVRVAYAEASRDAERALGEHLTQRADVQNQVRALVKAAWDNLSDVERLELGSKRNSGSGSVGNDLTTLKAVVNDGNIREQMHLLVSGVHGPLMKRLGLKKPEPEILTRERSAQGTPEDQRIQQDTDVVRDIRREQERLRKDEAANPGLEALVRAAERHRRTELRPEDAVPPLSARERAHALEDGRLTWEPGERHRQIALRTKSQVTAEATGGLMSAGTSNTTYFALTVVHAMAQKWKVPVDYQLVRLALMADMLPIGHHTFHEVMTASEAFEQNVLAARQPQSAGTPPYADVLSYTDDWGRFRSLAPLTEDALRQAMPGGRFPDEVALGLEADERTPHALSSLSSDRRNLRALPDPELKALLDGTPGLTLRTAGLLREALGDGSHTSRDWRRFDADSFLDLHERATRPDDAPGEPQRGVWDELDSIMERWYGMDPDIPEPDPLRQNLNSSFDAYYTALAGDPGDGTRLTALAGLLLKLREGGNLPAEGADVSAALGVVAQRLLVDQGYPPALWGTDVGSPDFWPNDAPSLVRKLEAAIGDFTRLHPVRQTPTGIAVGPMSAAQSRVLGSLPPSPGVFVVGTHTDPDTPHDPSVLLKALTDAHDQGRLTGITEIRFTGCDLATPLHENTVRTVMSGLWKHRAETGTDTGPLTALAADAPVWHVPGGDGLFTARRVGVTADGKVTVFGDGADWHRYSDTGAPDHTAESVPVGDDGAPADAVRTTRGDDPAYEDAVRFGDEDSGDEAASISMTVDGLTVPAQRTVEFRKGEKTLTEEGRRALQDLAMELFPELARRADDPSLGELRIHVSAGGNNLLPGAAKAVGEERALAVSGALATEIRKLAFGLGLPDANAMALFTPVSRGRDTSGLDTAHDTHKSDLRRRATVSSSIQNPGTPDAQPVIRSLRTHSAVVDLFRRLADPGNTYRAPLSLDDLTGSRIYRKDTPDMPEDHNLVFRVESPEHDTGTQRPLHENLVSFPLGTQVRVVSFDRMDSGRYLVSLREVGPHDTQGPHERPREPVIGIPDVSYPGPNRPFDSTLTHDKGEKDNSPAKNKGKGRKDESEEAGDKQGEGEQAVQNTGHYKFRRPLYIHRGEVEVEMTREGPHVRFYTVVTNQTDLRIDRAAGTVSSDQFKDIQQDPVTGKVLLATGPTMEGTMWTGIGTPARAIAWSMKYKAEKDVPEQHRPLIRSYLVPLSVYQRITTTSVPEGDAHALGDPYRGSDSLDPRKLRDPVDPLVSPENMNEGEDAYRRRWEAQEKGSAPAPIPGPEPLSDRTVNTDQPGERNQFGIRGEHLELLRASIVPGSLVTYYEDESHLSPESPDPSQSPESPEPTYRKNGDAVHVDELRGRLGIPGVGDPALNSSYNPWVQNRKHVNSPEKLRSISTALRQHHTTWQHSRQRRADRMPSLLLDHDTAVMPYQVRLKNLEKFLKEHERVLPETVNRLVAAEALLDRPDSDDMPPDERKAKEDLDDFMRKTVLNWASHAEIGYLLALQHKEVKADRNLTDAPLAHDFDEMRLRHKEDVRLQIQVGEDLTRMWKAGEPTYQLLNRLIRDYPELSYLYAEICAPTEKYTFFHHAQMVLGQYLKLAHPDRDDPRRVVLVDSIVKAILFHDIEKANSKEMYGGKKDPDEEQDQEPEQKKVAKKPEQHDHESEHIGAVDVMSRYRYLWGDVDGNEEHAGAYAAAVRMVDSDPFGFYYRDGHSDDKAKNLDATFHWVVSMYLDLRGRRLMTSDGTTRALAVLDTADTDGIRRLFHEFHQYYQADFSSYTVHSSYHDYGDPERRRRAILSGEDPNVSGVVPGSAPERKNGRKTFDQYFLPVGDEGASASGNPYGTGPEVVSTPSVGGRPSLRFAFTDHRDYQAKYDVLAALFKDHDSVVTSFERIGGERMRTQARSLGDTANAQVVTPASPPGNGGGPSTSTDADDDVFGGLWGEEDGDGGEQSTDTDDDMLGGLWNEAGGDDVTSFGGDGGPAPGLRITAYETVGTAPGARRTGEARVELFAEGADPIALALTGAPKDAGSFPAYRPVRPVGTAEAQPALQLSDDRRFAVPDQPGGAREFYATADAVAAARTRLLPAAGTRLEVDPESSVRFTLDGVEHTLHRVTVRGGDPGTVPLVLAGDAGSRHVTLQGDVRPELRDADMRRAVDANLDHYGPELHALAETLERADPGRTDPRTVLARALADLHRTREEGAGPAALAWAEAEAVRAFRDTVGDEYGSPEDDWQVRLAEPTAPVELSASDWSVF
ncbi:hypothetical protein ACIRQY_17850 [Streptomyces sp. NPDC101490]|uniref:WXG100-like domain-containing protein n=1 Tax=Streptomyces sp. NPDC101490 TaxID=3366143 RepID=UPI0038164355